MNIEDSIKTLKEFNKIKINSYAMQFVNISYPDLQEAIETLLTAYNDIKIEHEIMKRIIVENGLWEKLLNDDKFIKHLEEE